MNKTNRHKIIKVLVSCFFGGSYKIEVKDNNVEQL